jgi:uncharacterized protein (TIGR00730 family)
LKRIAVFCGSGKGHPRRPHYLESARETGRTLAERGIGVVYGGGRIGLMGAVADSALEAGGEVIGVIPESIAALEVAHTGLTELHIVASMHERKALMASLADAFLALPGGYGTFEEFFEALTWAQLGLHRKPCGLLNVQGYYSHFLAQVNHAVNEEFVPPVHRDLILHDADLNPLLDRLLHYTPPPLHRWLEPTES